MAVYLWSVKASAFFFLSVSHAVGHLAGLPPSCEVQSWLPGELQGPFCKESPC